MCKWSNHCLHHLLSSKRDTGIQDILISWFLIILVLLDVALLFVCCLIHCKHMRLSDVNKHTYLLTYYVRTRQTVYTFEQDKTSNNNTHKHGSLGLQNMTSENIIHIYPFYQRDIISKIYMICANKHS